MSNCKPNTLKDTLGSRESAETIFSDLDDAMKQVEDSASSLQLAVEKRIKSDRETSQDDE